MADGNLSAKATRGTKSPSCLDKSSPSADFGAPFPDLAAAQGLGRTWSTSACRGARRAQGAAPRQSRCRLLVAHASRRCPLRGARSFSPIQCTRMRRGVVSWRKLANDAASAQPWSSLVFYCAVRAAHYARCALAPDVSQYYVCCARSNRTGAQEQAVLGLLACPRGEIRRCRRRN